MSKTYYGVAINDAGYSLTRKVDSGVTLVCPFYRVWMSMVVRCYSKKHQEKAVTYAGCTVCDEWLTFSNFKAWMEKQDWQGKELDKDIIKQGNKIYCPEFCSFVTKGTNLFISDNKSNRGKYKIGVSFHKQTGKLRATCRNPFTDRCEHLGLFADELSAHLAWLERKRQLAVILAGMQTDLRVSAALIDRYGVS